MLIDISLIIPVYNTGPYLEECLKSILNQTKTELEIIIIDDASTDNSKEILEAYSAQSSRINVISLEKNTPGGAGVPSNLGIEMAQGKYIGFIDSDDRVEPDMFEKLYSEAEKSESDFVFCDFSTFENQTKLVSESYDRSYWESAINDDMKMNLFHMSPVPWRKLYRRDFLLKHNLRFPEGDFFFEDTPFHIMVSLKADKISYVDKVLYQHRVSRLEQTMHGKGEKFLAFADHFQTILSFLSKEKLLEKYASSFCTFVIDNAFWIWDRLNNTQRQLFFERLHNLIGEMDEPFISHYIHSTIPWNAIRLKAIQDGNFKEYRRLMFKFKSKWGFIYRTIDYFRENGLIQTIKRII